MKTPIRTCAGCGARRIKNKMIRVGLDEAGDPMLTGIGKHRGRGSYVCADAECVDRAKKNKGLHRLLRRDIPPSIYSDLQIEIEDRQKVASG